MLSLLSSSWLFLPSTISRRGGEEELKIRPEKDNKMEKGTKERNEEKDKRKDRRDLKENQKKNKEVKRRSKSEGRDRKLR